MGGCFGGVAPTVQYGQTKVGPKSVHAYGGGKKWYVTRADAKVEARLAAEGPASAKECESTTMIQILRSAAKAKGGVAALSVEEGLQPWSGEGPVPPAFPREKWATWSYSDYLRDVESAAAAFIQLGFKEFESVNVWAFNRPEWHISAMAANFAGGKVAGLYPTDAPDTAAYKVVHSAGSIIVLDDQKKIDKLVKALAENGKATRVKAIVCIGFQPATETLKISGCEDVKLLTWQTLVNMSSEKSKEEMKARCSRVEPGHCASLIYTSGTTGDPKAVMISHDSLVFEAYVFLDLLNKSTGFANQEERIVSYLPLSHVAGMLLDIVAPVVGTAKKKGYASVFFARAYDLKAGSIKDRLVAAEPTAFLGVPLVWEKIADKIKAIGAANTGLKKKMGDWAKRTSLEKSREMQLGGSGSTPCCDCLASYLMGKVKQNLGLHKCKIGLTGAAPIRADTLEYYGSLQLQINEVYGMSECTGAATVSLPLQHQWGSCGFEVPGVSVRTFIIEGSPHDGKKTECPLAPALDAQEEKYQGELCYRGRNVMMGYLANPDLGDAHVAEIEQKTKESIDSEGWLHSGDKGMITKDGMVKITGRYKELIITDGGENIAPVPIEDFVKKQCDGINEVMMVGDHRKYNVALITLKAKGANGEVPGEDALEAGAARVNPAVQTISGAIEDPVWIKKITDAIQAANSNGKICPNGSFKIQKFTILPANFSEQNNELTPTKKLKRKVVEKGYSALIETMYKTSGVYIKHAQ